MTPLIDTLKEQAALRAEAAEWMGTPFAPRQAVKGAAVDCVNFPRELLRRLGGRFDLPYGDYTVDRSKHSAESLILAWMESMPAEVVRVATITRFEDGLDRKPQILRRQAELAALALRTGDVLVFQLNRCADHCGVLLNSTDFAHAVWPVGVTHGHLFDPTWATSIHSVWRPLRLQEVRA